KFNINDDGKASSYRQAAMKSIEPSEGANNDKKQVNTAKSAIEALYYNRYLKRNDEVTNVRLGYCTVVKEPNVQVLEVNWVIKVKHKDESKTYYVEAISDSTKIVEEYFGHSIYDFTQAYRLVIIEIFIIKIRERIYEIKSINIDFDTALLLCTLRHSI